MKREFKIAVCIVDDNQVETMIHKRILENFGYDIEVTEYTDYLAFIEYLECNSDNVDLVLLDINMGDRTHFTEKVKEIKTIAALAYILILTSSDRIEDFLEASIAQCNGFIAKGYDVAYYLEKHLEIIYNKISLRNNFINKVEND